MVDVFFIDGFGDGWQVGMVGEQDVNGFWGVVMDFCEQGSVVYVWYVGVGYYQVYGLVFQQLQGLFVVFCQ